jgi:zinc/manganese transport system substrate-binding protein
VRRIEIPASVDRSQGDVHPQGNPHIHLHPRNIERVAEALADRLGQLDSANAEAYRANADDFLRRWNEARVRWEEQAASLAGLRPAGKNRRHRLPACAWFRTIAASAISPTGWTSTSLPRSNPSRASRRAAHTCRGSSSS